ncbi:MAG: hypothetical protein PHV63_01310 [Candidatus Daviesbacteria bacterium]|nr:hypothetical protein [Candidatus Daviesbacteria bacterium]
MNNLYPKGSVWRKWDLQIHTPETKREDQYKIRGGIIDDVWNLFLERIKNSDVEVFGITDYFSIDGYEKLISKIQGNSDFEGKVFFPNIELRLDISLNQATEQLQCHLIFDPQCEIARIKSFLSRLPLQNKQPDESKCYCVDADITGCGGYDRVSISIEDLKKTLEDSFGNDCPYLIVGVASGMGSLRAVPSSNVKKELADSFDSFCDFFFGNANNKDYYLQTDRYENKSIQSKPKAVVTTSDCHSFSDLDNFLGKQFTNTQGNTEKDITWIKADKTFEGLKQILFEPWDRVAFGYERPESKKTYFLIDKIRFIDSTGNENFQSDPIEINNNLTAIIGGKSTGKSLLLYYIAKTIDPLEAGGRFTDGQLVLPYTFDENPNFNFEVVWTDGASTFLKNTGAQVKENERKILYIPQNYLNKLSERNIKSRETLNRFVMDVLLQDKEVKEKHESDLMQIKSLSKNIPISINNLYQFRDDILEIEQTLKQLGEESGIRKYLEQLQKEANEIKIKSGLTTVQIKDYEQLLNKEQEATRKVTLLSEDKKHINLFSQNIYQQLKSFENLKNEQLVYLEDEEIKNEFTKEFHQIETVRNNLLLSVGKIIRLIDTRVSEKQKLLEEIRKDLTPLMAKVKLQDELKKKNEEIKIEQGKLDRIAIEKKNLESKKNSHKNEKEFLIDVYKKIFGSYNSIKDEFKKYEKRFDGISLNVLVGFNEQRFNDEVINGCINKVDIKRLIDGTEWKDEYEYQYNPNEHIDFITAIFTSVIDGKIKTVKNKSTKEAVTKILDDYFYLDFKISYKNDSLDKMSPGKKGLVLLRILIDLSNEEWPILLDQPEDDLDNRSVYDDLVSFIKKKKKRRQIIFVTHNPNLVVGADAEEIIVANQEGQEKGRDNRKYTFEYVSGSLENAFELSESKEKSILYRKGVRQHVCEILEGGREAFQKREQKYNFKDV